MDSYSQFTGQLQCRQFRPPGGRSTLPADLDHYFGTLLCAEAYAVFVLSRLLRDLRQS